jgi:hypothetical protein
VFEHGLTLVKLVIALDDGTGTTASTLQMPPLSDRTQENLTSFIEGGLEIADNFLEDAVVHLQLRHFLFAGESLQNALQAMDLVERYLPAVAESDKLVQYVVNVSTARERVQVLARSSTSNRRALGRNFS